MTLNIGCGTDLWGDVRVDVRRSKATDILASSQYLPFKSGVFEEARMFHVLEHFKNPEEAFKEALRVSNHLHATFPYKYDRIPFVLTRLTSGSDFSSVLVHFYAIFWQTMTQLKLADHPMAHRWLIQPFGDYKLNKLPFPSIFIHGRKAKYLRKLVIWLPAEWECKL